MFTGHHVNGILSFSFFHILPKEANTSSKPVLTAF